MVRSRLCWMWRSTFRFCHGAKPPRTGTGSPPVGGVSIVTSRNAAARAPSGSRSILRRMSSSMRTASAMLRRRTAVDKGWSRDSFEARSGGWRHGVGCRAIRLPSCRIGRRAVAAKVRSHAGISRERQRRGGARSACRHRHASTGRRRNARYGLLWLVSAVRGSRQACGSPLRHARARALSGAHARPIRRDGCRAAPRGPARRHPPRAGRRGSACGPGCPARGRSRRGSPPPRPWR